MAGWPAPKTVYAATHATEMSVAVGMPQPRASVWKSSETAPDPVAMPRNTKYSATGPITPPSVPKMGLTAFRVGGYSEPPGWNASQISLTARPKKNAIRMSLTMKWSVSSWRRMDKPKNVGWLRPSSSSPPLRKRRWSSPWSSSSSDPPWCDTPAQRS